MAQVDLIIAGRAYKVACRDGEEDNLRSAARLVDTKSNEALAGLGTLSEARQLLFAGLLLADQLIENRPETATGSDPELESRAERLAERLESLADALESNGSRH